MGQHYNLQSDVGALAVIDFYGQPAIGGGKLVATCEMRWDDGAERRRAQVMVTGGVLKARGDEFGNHDLGFAWAYPPCLLEPSQSNEQSRFTLEVECSRAYLRELNALRGSGGFQVSASVQGWVLMTTVEPIPENPRDALVMHPLQPSAPATGRRSSPPQFTTKRLYSFQAPTNDYPVEPTKWLRVLGQCRFMRAMTFEVPLPDRGDASGLDEVAESMERAVTLHRQGDFLSEAAVASLRKVLDALEEWRPELRMTDGEARDYVATYNKNGGAPKDLRIRCLLWSVRRLTDLAHHGRPVWTRHDAEYVITTLATLIRRLVEDLPLRSVVP